MSWWWPGQGRTASAPSRPVQEPAETHREDAGEYHSLFVYLRDRYADRVVMNFTDIEGLLGFALPDLARVQREWWGVADPPARPSAQSHAWTLASRTAIANVAAQTVVFDRAPIRSHRGG